MVVMKPWIHIVTHIHVHLITLFFAQGMPGKLDLGIAIDTSYQLDPDSANNFLQIAIDFAEALLQHYSISQGTTRVSLATLSDNLRVLLSYQKHANREYLLESLRSIRCCSEKRMTAKAIQRAIELFQHGNEIRRSKLFIMIPGEDSFKTARLEIEKENHQHRKGREIIVVLIGEESENSTITDECVSMDGCFVLYSTASIERVTKEMGLPKKNYTSCADSGRKTFDECERHCDCVNGRLRNCYRIRKEFTQMTKQERQRYLRTYMRLTTQQPYKNRYEKFVYLHFKYFCYGIHRRDQFCPWHRFYVLQMENLLREIDCRVTLPYWDWSHVADDPWNRTAGVWHEDDGLGGNGVKRRGFCVQSGRFRQGKWYTPFFNNELDIIMSTLDLFDGNIKEHKVVPDLSDCLRRYFYGTLPDRVFLKRSLQIPPDRFKDFDINLRINYHDRIHNAIGGTMCTHYAATAPEFFLHHAFLDKIWFLWQQKSTAHRDAHFRDTNMKLVGFTHRAEDVISSHHLPGHVKVTYSKFPAEVARDKRHDLYDGEYLDDNNKPLYSVFHGIIQKASHRIFPSCDRSKAEKRRANQLYDMFSHGRRRQRSLGRPAH